VLLSAENELKPILTAPMRERSALRELRCFSYHAVPRIARERAETARWLLTLEPIWSFSYSIPFVAFRIQTLATPVQSVNTWKAALPRESPYRFLSVVFELGSTYTGLSISFCLVDWFWANGSRNNHSDQEAMSHAMEVSAQERWFRTSPSFTRRLAVV
jgi:hypothetical protein